MLRSIRDLLKCGVDTPEGSLGGVKDLFFDDETWEIKFVVAGEPEDKMREPDTRKELMIPLPAIRETNWEENQITLPVSCGSLIRRRLGVNLRPKRTG